MARFPDSARRVVSRFRRRAMSFPEAFQALGLDPRSNPSPDDINRAYRQKYIENRKLHPDSGGDPAQAVQLNVAKDVLLGKMRPDRGSAPPSGWRPPSRPQDDARDQRQREQEEFWRKKKEEEARKKSWTSKNKPPSVEGSSLQAALGGVGWRVAGYAGSGYDFDAVDGENGDRVGFKKGRRSWILIGKAQDRFVIMKLTRNRNTWNDDPSSNPQEGWVSEPLYLPATVDFMKVAPKTIKQMTKESRPKFVVLNAAVTSEYLDKVYGGISLKDALVGSGLLETGHSAVRGRAAQIELTPVLNNDKRKKVKETPGNRKEWALAYDWYLSINGKKHELTDQDVLSLGKHYILMSIFSYDYSTGGKNITRLRGGNMKMGAVETLRQMAKALPKYAQILNETADAIEAKKSKRKKASDSLPYDYDFTDGATL